MRPITTHQIDTTSNIIRRCAHMTNPAGWTAVPHAPDTWDTLIDEAAKHPAGHITVESRYIENQVWNIPTIYALRAWHERKHLEAGALDVSLRNFGFTAELVTAHLHILDTYHPAIHKHCIEPERRMIYADIAGIPAYVNLARDTEDPWPKSKKELVLYVASRLETPYDPIEILETVRDYMIRHGHPIDQRREDSARRQVDQARRFRTFRETE